MKIARMPLVGSLNPRTINGTLGDKDQRFVNCFPESAINEATKTQTLYLVKRPGLQLYQAATGFTVQQIMTWSGQTANFVANPPRPIMLTMYSSTVMRLYSEVNGGGSLTQVHSLTDSNFKYADMSETIISGVPYIVYTLVDRSDDGVAAIRYSDGTTESELTASTTNFPDTDIIKGRTVHMDGFTFILRLRTDQGIQHSNINTLATWGAGQTIQTDIHPDTNVAFAKTGNKLVAFGTNSVEFFSNTGNASGSVLSRIAESAKKIGCVSHKAVCEFADSLAWVGTSSDTGMYDLYTMRGGEIEKVTSGEISKYLSSCDMIGVDDIYIDAFKMSGLTFIFITTKDSSATKVTLCFCVENKFWFEWTPAGTRYPTTAAGRDNVAFIASAFETTGKLYKLDSASPVYQDDSSAYTMTWQVGPSDFGTGNRKFVEYYELVADKQASGTTTLEICDNDGVTWTTLGTFDMTANKKRIHRGGSFTGRGHRLTHSANTAWRGQFLDIYGTVGAT